MERLSATGPFAASSTHGIENVNRGAEIRPGALGPDAAAMRLHDSLADRQTEAHPPGLAPAVRAIGPRELPEQLRQLLGGDAPALVRDGDDDVDILDRRRHADRGRTGRVAGGVGEEVVQDLDDALLVSRDSGAITKI